MSDKSQKRQILLAIDALQSDPNLTFCRAAKIYEVPHTIIQRRMNSTTTKPDSKNGRAKLTKSEEDAIVQYISDLDLRGFSLSKADVEDMANLLLAKRGARRVGKCWIDHFIIR